MGKGGGGGSGNTTQDVRQSNMPSWAKGAHEKLIGEAEKFAYERPYPTYGGERIAEFTPQEEAGFRAREEMFSRGDPFGDYAAGQLTAAGEVPGQFTDVTPGYGAREFDFGGFTSDVAQQYMSPYQQAVTDAELRAARDEYERQLNSAQAESVASGARGGYREAVDNMMGRSMQARTLGEIQARGSQEAFSQAQQQYQRDREAAIRAAEMGDRSALSASKMRMEADLANQQRMFEEAGLRTKIAGLASDLGTVGQTRGLERIRELERAGVSQREMGQAHRDLAYEDFLRQERWPQTQMNWLQGILSGIPGQMGTYTKSPGPSTVAQLLGLGVGSAGLGNLLGGKS